MSLDDEARAELEALARAGRLREPRVLQSRQGTSIVVEGRRVTSFASNDYLGLAGDPQLERAAREAVEADGVGVGASRLLAGNHEAHVELEESVAHWIGTPAARLFNSGYAANVGVLGALLGPDDSVFSDELNHASIIDGCRLSRARIHVFRHRDLDGLDRLLQQHGGRRRLVVSESVFSMDGDVADVAGLAELCKRHEAILMLDEAHALGVLGPHGRGVAAMANVVPDLLIGTFGKALGTFGAFAATSRAVADLLWNRARSLVFSTGLPPALARATSAAIAIVRGADGDQLRSSLDRLLLRFRDHRPTLVGHQAPIIPVIVGDDSRTVAIGQHLLEHGILVAAVRPPTVPAGTARLRISISARHALEDIDTLTELLHRVIPDSPL